MWPKIACYRSQDQLQPHPLQLPRLPSVQGEISQGLMARLWGQRRRLRQQKYQALRRPHHYYYPLL